eukprot:440144-Hanusia_phi.AAC.2
MLFGGNSSPSLFCPSSPPRHSLPLIPPRLLARAVSRDGKEGEECEEERKKSSAGSDKTLVGADRHRHAYLLVEARHSC